MSRKLAAQQGNYDKMLEFAFEKPENNEKFDLIKREIREYMKMVNGCQVYLRKP